jgi:transposase
VVVVSDGRFAGVDWASAEHAVCVVDGRGRMVEGRRFGHDESGIRALCARLVRLDVALVAIERPDGLLIERLLDAGLLVVAVHPNQVKAMRPRYSVAGGKSDVFDSFVLAELARTDSHRFRVLVPDSDQTKALRASTRARESLVRTRIGLANQLRDQLACFWPGATRVFCSVDTGIALAFLRRYPSPADARGLGEQRLAAFLKRHGYTGRKPARELLARLRGGAESRADELELAARRQIVLALVSALEPIVARISELTIEIRRQIQAHPDGNTFRSLFIDPNSWLCAATMIAEIGDCRDRYPSYRALAADAGQAPVAVESGKSRHAKFRSACDHRLRDAFDTLADSTRRHNPWAADIYTRARARGAGHAHATRVLGRAWCQVIWRLWHDHDAYDPNRHTALQRLLATRS